MKEFFQKLKTRIHYAAPLVVARRVLSLFANRLTDPLLELRLRKVVVIDPALVASRTERCQEPFELLCSPKFKGSGSRRRWVLSPAYLIGFVAAQPAGC